MTAEEREVQVLAIKAQKALMNLTPGLQATVLLPDGINILALQLGCELPKMKALVLELLAGVCFFPPKGHQLFLEALHYYKEKKGEKFRFESIVKPLGVEAVSPSDIDHRVTHVR